CRPLHKLGFAEGFIETVAFSADEKSVAAIGRPCNLVRLWSTESGALIDEFDAPPDRPGHLLFNPAGNLLAVMRPFGESVRVLRVGTQELVADLSFGMSKRPDMAFSADGAMFATLDEVNATLWTTADWKEEHRFRGRAVPDGWLLFSPDGHALLKVTTGT